MVGTLLQMPVNGKFVSQKISKIRWRPVPTNDALQSSSVFVTGSWDDEMNTISMWQYSADCCHQLTSAKSRDSIESDPKLLFETNHDGHVTDIKYLNCELMIASSTTGSVALYCEENQMLKLYHTWKQSHHFKVHDAPCTAVDAYNNSIVSVGEDGRLIIYSVNQLQRLRVIDADICTITGVVYSNQNEIITSNTSGQLKLWDTRSPSNEPEKLLLPDGDPESLLCITRHPTQPSILACGTDEGTLCIWDTRQEKYPLTPISAHDGPILEVKFHPTSPNHLFTCSMDGKIWHWDSSPLANIQTPHQLIPNVPIQSHSLCSPWLACGASKHHLEITSLIPSSCKSINTLDILDNTLICASDNEAIYMISNVKLA